MESKKTDAFLKYIRKQSKAKCQETAAETEKVRAIRLQELEEEAQKKYKDYVAYEVDKIAAETNREIANLKEQARKESSALRQTLCDRIFEAVQQELRDYRTTDAYAARLLQDAKALSAYCNDQAVTLFLAKEDRPLASQIQAAFQKPCKLIFCDDILYGGIKGLDTNSQKMIDFTLDAELENEKVWFLEHSDLAIEE